MMRVRVFPHSPELIKRFNVEINIEPKDIDNYVKEAILNSSVGKILKDNLENELKNLMKGYHSPIQKACAEVLEKMVKEYLDKPECKDMINVAICKFMTKNSVEKIIQYGLDKLIKEVRSSYEDD